MYKGKYNTFLNVVLIILIILIVSATGFAVYEYIYKKYKSAEDAQKQVAEFDNFVNNNHHNIIIDLDEQDENTTPAEENNTQSNGSSGSTYNVNKNYGLTYKGYGVLGKIELPKVGLQYPILETMTDANSIDVSVAVQYGVGLNKPGNTVIIGHNYRNGTFFGSNRKLEKGDKVYITDLSGQRKEYTIYKKYLTPQEDFKYAQRDTKGAREITLVTCHTDNKFRLVILAKES